MENDGPVVLKTHSNSFYAPTFASKSRLLVHPTPQSAFLVRAPGRRMVRDALDVRNLAKCSAIRSFRMMNGFRHVLRLVRSWRAGQRNTHRQREPPSRMLHGPAEDSVRAGSFALRR